ncbi:PfaD family polyunsaturated fatty acid/polyketide biosynthesis protein [Geotalea toluenoxydans]|uniref:PfaD family polyunsaturated fatty acid/polyketide biosynthesis protein n=1 Tax=Geotalea toluenoxydans TaxID=421624 RepID=UPI0024371AF1|nr:PfaD family polyunsaturated fatty acid/polyketide biosynthesis protein [Geotalea toluenoxydans]
MLNQFQTRSDATGHPSEPACPGWWLPSSQLSSHGNSLSEALRQVTRPLYLVNTGEAICAKTDGSALFGQERPEGGLPIMGQASPCLPEKLGDAQFCRDLGIRYPYIGGSMAKGISSAAMAEELGRAGMFGFFGAAGLPFAEVEATADKLSRTDIPYGFNLIHSPHEPDLEDALSRLYIDKGIRVIEASAFLALTLPLVRYRVHGIHRAADGAIVTPNRIIAKVSREELAARFFSPPPEKHLRSLIAAGEITEAQAELAAQIPMAQDITAEADSGGHTDNRPAIALFPTILSLAAKHQANYSGIRLRVGLGGGISTPAAAAAAFAMGAAYIVTGSVNQACVESGTCEEVRKMLAETRQADVTMAPAADMFEMGVTVQVLKRGTMFPMRAARLYEIYRTYGSMDEIPAAEKDKLEQTLFRNKLENIWQDTRAYFQRRDPSQVERADRDPKHRMALVFRWYLGQGAHWARDGEPTRKMDYQVWCGPAMGAFNEWTAGSFLEQHSRRTVVSAALNILFGAAVQTRAAMLSCQGIRFTPEELQIQPLETAKIKEYLR